MMRIRHVSCREILAGNILHRIPAKKLQHPSPNFGICVVLVHGSHRINAFVRQEAGFNPLVGLPVICQRLTFSWIITRKTPRSLRLQPALGLRLVETATRKDREPEDIGFAK